MRQFLFLGAMHIKQVSIEGFKSYKDRTSTEPFDPRLNAIVGANGSGKTNLFHAIRFVVNDVFTQLRQDERQQLLHEGVGGAVTTASVEVVLDNTDRRFPSERDEVRLKRSIGLKKDEFFIDQKHTTRKEFVDLLEAAGISRSNPYYVVQQGKIVSMANMRDSERLELLKEIGGVKVYEERRKDSAKIMNETSANRIQIEDMIKSIENKLAQLDEEREELMRYQRLDKKRRGLEFTLFSNERQQVVEEMERLKAEEDAAVGRVQGATDRFQEMAEKLRKLEKEGKGLEELKALQLRNQAAASDQKARHIRDFARLELDVRELEAKVEGTEGQMQHDRAELAVIETQIQQQTSALEELEAELRVRAATESRSVQQRLGEAQSRLQMLLQKQGRDAQFSSAAERDRWILSEILELQTASQHKHQSIQTLKQNAAQQQKQLQKYQHLAQGRDWGRPRVEGKFAEWDEERERCRGSISQCEHDVTARRSERDEMQNQRRALLKQTADLDAALHHLQTTQATWEKQLEKAMPPNLKRSLEMCVRIAREEGIDGVYGILGDLIKCREPYFTAVEVTARNHLFSLVVRSSAVAESLIQRLVRDKLGRVTFIPLDQLPPWQERELPSFGSRASPLAKFLKVEPDLRPMLHHVFGKTVLVADLTVEAEGFNCVTTEGDEVRKNGTMKGGHYDPSRSKMKAIKEAARAREERQEKETERTNAGKRVEGLDRSIAQCLTQIENLTISSQTHKSKLQHVRSEMRGLLEQREKLKAEVASLQGSIAAAEASQAQLQTQIEALRSEQGAPLRTTLTPSEKSEIHTLNHDIKDMERRLGEAEERTGELEKRRVLTKEKLERNLKLRREELENRLSQDPSSIDQDALGVKRRDLALLQSAIDAAQREEDRIQTCLEHTAAQLKEIRHRLQGLQDADGASKRCLDAENASMEKHRLQRQHLEQRRSDIERKIRDVGSIPEDAFGKYSDGSIDELYGMLKKVKGALAKLSHVNKKAADQYMSFTEQKHDMIRRHKSLIQSEETIKGLIRFLDMQKDEAIERTFKGVAGHFKEIFSSLVPAGAAELVMQKRIFDDDSDPESEPETLPEAERRPSILDLYAGVKVKVRFDRGGETVSLKQLSGGQKTLVALTLIFAIQKCDPAPFYLFDEIDAALDPLHRTAVAQLLKKQVADVEHSAQYILTTFHPQIVEECHKLYGVSHHNRISTVNVIHTEQAIQFLQSQDPTP